MRPTPDTFPVTHFNLAGWRFAIDRLNPPRAAVARRYDRGARGWHALLDRLQYPAAYARVLDAALPFPRHAPLAALDCGTGSGGLALALADRWRGPLDLTLCDISANMLDEASSRLARRNIPVWCGKADLEALPYADNRFDLTMAGHVLEHFTDPRVALAEMIRVTRPGGRIVFCVTRATLAGLWIQLRWPIHRFSRTGLQDMLTDAGLENITLLPTLPGSLPGKLSLAGFADIPKDFERT